MSVSEASKVSKSASNELMVHATDKNIQLLEDNFGYVVNKTGKQHYVKRFTWKNHNSIQVQAITYGARITSLQLPNRKGIVEDVVLGFDDVAGYLHYGNLYMGATIGRVTDKTENATFQVNKKQFWLTPNSEQHHFNGGNKGLDKYVWDAFVSGTTVKMSCVSRNLDEGYPGDMFIEVSFQLTPKNEFHINMEARTTKTTVVNLSNLLYFNLGGHRGQRDEILKHMVTINANCGLVMRNDGLPSGEIQNVIFTRNDFQIPKLAVELEEGYESYLCVNRGTGQDLCFVARAIHPPSGRVLEMYSNQCGVHYSTADHFGAGLVDIPVRMEKEKSSCSLMTGSLFELLDQLHSNVAKTLSLDSQSNYLDLKRLICKFKKRIKFSGGEEEVGDEKEELVTEDSLLQEEEGEAGQENINAITLNPMQVKYLEEMHNVISSQDSLTGYSEIGTIIKEILDVAIVLDLEDGVPPPEAPSEEYAEAQRASEARAHSLQSQKLKEDAEMNRKGTIRLKNKNPSFNDDGQIHGKNGVIYKKQGAICFQSENYPNAIYHKNFPNSVLNPGEVYRHNIVYKFWVQSGNPTKWVKRNFPTKSK